MQALQEAAGAVGLEPGIDLAARGSATIGGMVSTNAGGVMAFRYGVMRHRILGLQAILANGQIYDDLTRVVKANLGYDTKHLFIGSEGTLGLVTRVVLKLEPRPGASARAHRPALIDAALHVVQAINARGLQMRAAEAMWHRFSAATAAANGIGSSALGLDAPVHLIIEVEGGNAERLSADFEDCLSEIVPLVEAGHIVAPNRPPTPRYLGPARRYSGDLPAFSGRPVLRHFSSASRHPSLC